MRRRLLPPTLTTTLVVAVAAAALLAGTAAASARGPEQPPAPCGWLESDPPRPAPCSTGPAGDGADDPVEQPVAGAGAAPGAPGVGASGTATVDDGYWTPERMASARPMPMPHPD
jgi:hypothetical protein